MSIVSNNIKYLRRINGLTQEQFSRRIGIKRSLLGAYEEARANPNLDNLKLMANIFGVSVDALIKSDIRKLKETPDISFDFEPKSTEPLLPAAKVYRPIMEPKTISELMQGLPDPFLREAAVKEQENSFEIFTKPQAPEYKPEPPPPVVPELLPSGIKLIKKHQQVDYIRNHKNPQFLNQLIGFSLPFLPLGNLRAFETNEDFSFENAILIGKFVESNSEIQDGKNYVLISQMNGILYRRVYNQVKIKGTLLLSIDNHPLPSQEISINDVLEIWEVIAFISQTLPQNPPNLNKIVGLIDQIKSEIDRISK